MDSHIFGGFKHPTTLIRSHTNIFFNHINVFLYYQLNKKIQDVNNCGYLSFRALKALDGLKSELNHTFSLNPAPEEDYKNYLLLKMTNFYCENLWIVTFLEDLSLHLP